MEISSPEWHTIIFEGAQQMGIAIDERMSAAFAVHAAELLRWNRKMNLTAITDPRDIAIRHFLDSLAPAKFIPEGARLLDIGSGAGFPGMPLKIVKSSLFILLIDSTRKKINFLKHMIRSLDIDQSEAIQIRAEKLSEATEFAHSFDIIISRALSDLTSFVKVATPLLAKQGVIMAMKGEFDHTELDMLRTEILGDRFSVEVQNYSLPSILAHRSIVIIKHLH